MNKRALRTVLLVGLLMASVPLLATTFNRVIQPQRHAEAGRCVAADTNQCDFAIIIARCQQGDTQDRNADTCRLQQVEPGASFTADLDEASVGNRYTMACKAPFIPKWGPSLSNAAIQKKRCRRPDPAAQQ